MSTKDTIEPLVSKQPSPLVTTAAIVMLRNADMDGEVTSSHFKLRDIYEADRKSRMEENEKLRALVQRLVDALQVEKDGWCEVNEDGDYFSTVEALKSAKEQGFTPSNTTKG